MAGSLLFLYVALCACGKMESTTSNSASTNASHDNASTAVRHNNDRQALEEWHAGNTIDAQAVRDYGIDRCFTATPIPDGVWQRMQGKTYTDNEHIRRNDLAHIRVLHWGFDQQIHIGEMVCNRIIADRLVRIFRTLYDAQYQIERMVLPDEYDADDERQMQADNTSCFCYRVVAGSKSLSKHAWGLAVDINPLYNPYCKLNGKKFLHVQPKTALKYCDRSQSFPHKIDHNDLAYQLFHKEGFTWGGDWNRTKDYQHFEWKNR